MHLSGKVAIVTGGAMGLGEAHVRCLHDAGAIVVVADIQDDQTEALAASLGARARAAHLDVRDAAEWEAVVAETEQAVGPIGILVNNAGIVDFGGVVDMSEEVLRRLLDVNVVGVFLGMKATVPSMERAGGGSIVNISSIDGMMGAAGSIGYTASKWAVRGMTKAAAIELAPLGIRVNSVHPGLVDTPMSRSAPRTSGVPPIGRIGRPDDIARTVVHLASDASSFTTGAEFVIDGGRTAGW
jgi:3alpha(or 20beta)-hydroxysteroid dehydrogenase